MDLKTINVSLKADIGDMDGNALNIVQYLREEAISELNKMLENELNIEVLEFTDYVETFAEDNFLNEDNDEGDLYEREPEIEYEEDLVEEDNLSELDTLDTGLGAKVILFADVIKFYDNIISTNGIVSDNVTTLDIINKFKTLEGVYNTYGEFTFSTNFTVAQ